MTEVGEYRIDELARAAGTTSRNVRLYQEKGLLPAPVRRAGRANIYGDAHLARLRIIDGLLARGFTTAHIADFITSWETGKDLTEILGLQHAVTAAWGQSRAPVEFTRDMVDAILGDPEPGHADDAHLDRLVRLGLVRVHDGGSTIELLRPQLLEAVFQLKAYGIEVPTLIDLYAEVMGRLDDIARRMVAAAKDHIVSEHGLGWLPDTDDAIADTTQMLRHWRELGTGMVHSGLDQALDRALERELGDYLAAAARAHTSPGADLLPVGDGAVVGRRADDAGGVGQQRHDREGAGHRVGG
ncbi:MerR family transcriptional regulator [Nocardia cyriacigeorgica]|uniref:MerR family transcriptional regulator n=1 Tax=Nocardia cyriacigeorgica TaxID=135487 RepID=UPI002B4B75B0|nr:MerR family transcriptional regulator [Nocardia cyriacigeorgica]